MPIVYNKANGKKVTCDLHQVAALLRYPDCWTQDAPEGEEAAPAAAPAAAPSAPDKKPALNKPKAAGKKAAIPPQPKAAQVTDDLV